MTNLPTPRHLVTSILNSLTLAPTPEVQTRPTDASYDPPSNPFKNLPASHRALLTTLHVLFPPPTLLQALDVLDRGLVTRVVLADDTEHVDYGKTDTGGLEGAVVPPQTNVHLPQAAHSESKEGTEQGMMGGKTNKVYQVRSSQAPKGRFKDVGRVGSSIVYTVRLEAWNCSCAAFVFAAFPSGRAWVRGEEEEEEEMHGDSGKGEDDKRELEVGGMSKDEGNVPVCKHLLACLLGERWEAVLGGYVKKRKVGREELAGIGGES